MSSAVIIDTGGANLASVAFAIERAGHTARTSSDPDVITRATHVILPGVGAAGASMERLRAAELVPLIQELEQPVLGICLGMQLLFQHSEEGDTNGLDILPGTVRKLSTKDGLVVPHMGWNQVHTRSHGGVVSRLFDGIADGSHFYFVHSFAATDGYYTLGTSDYGGEFPAVVGADNFFGVQFHPEKSAAAGARLFENFLRM